MYTHHKTHTSACSHVLREDCFYHFLQRSPQHADLILRHQRLVGDEGKINSRKCVPKVRFELRRLERTTRLKFLSVEFLSGIARACTIRAIAVLHASFFVMPACTVHHWPPHDPKLATRFLQRGGRYTLHPHEKVRSFVLVSQCLPFAVRRAAGLVLRGVVQHGRAFTICAAAVCSGRPKWHETLSKVNFTGGRSLPIHASPFLRRGKTTTSLIMMYKAENSLDRADSRGDDVVPGSVRRLKGR